MKVLSEQELKEKLAGKIKSGEGENEVQQVDIKSQDSNPEKELKKYFLSLLSKREHSQSELRSKAEMRQYDETLIEKILKVLVEENYQSDQRYAEMVVRARINKQTGPVKIRMELKQKGVASSIIENVLNASDCDWFELAASCARKKYKPVKENAGFTEKQKARAKLMRFLQGRGFDSEQIRYAVESVERG